MKISDSTSNETVSISLDAGANDPQTCSMCKRKFANYATWVRHYCAAFNTAHPQPEAK